MNTGTRSCDRTSGLSHIIHTHRRSHQPRRSRRKKTDGRTLAASRIPIPTNRGWIRWRRNITGACWRNSWRRRRRKTDGRRQREGRKWFTIGRGVGGRHPPTKEHFLRSTSAPESTKTGMRVSKVNPQNKYKIEVKTDHVNDQ